MENDNKKHIGRRSFLKLFGSGAAATAAVLAGCTAKSGKNDASATSTASAGEMTYRANKHGDKVSLLGYGMMRLPTIVGGNAREGDEAIDQEQVNALVDHALAHGVNYFDTSPVYCKGLSEQATGKALSRHSRSSYYVATKLSNFDPATWSREESIKMYHNSFKYLQVEKIDYLLLHGIGMGGMEALHGRYLDNGLLDYLLEERKAGRIGNLGFSYHGDVKVFDYLLSRHAEFQWDFVQIQLNYVDWKHAKEVNERNTNAEYLYNELSKRNIPVVIMEPLLGGRLANVNYKTAEMLHAMSPEASIASWAFRFAGTPSNVLTVLSGMTYMEHLQENLQTYSPLVPLTEHEQAELELAAKVILNFPLIPCTDCRYCMPCPYGLNIPAIFAHYNKCVNEGNIPASTQDADYAKLRKAFLVGYDRSVPRLRQANHCIGCNKCAIHCPQRIDIPHEMQRIDAFVETLKQGKEL